MRDFLRYEHDIHHSHWSRSTQLIAITLVTALLAAGCATTSSSSQGTLDNQTKHVARVRVESTPPGGTVILGDQTKGTTPTTVNLAYAVSHERILANRTRWGGGIVGLVLGGISLIGSAPFYLGGQALARRDEATGSLYSVAISLTVLGVIGAGLGIWAMVTSYDDRNRVVPHSFEIGLRTSAAPGLHTVHIETTDKMGRFDLLETLRFNAKTRRWWAPGEPAGIALTMRTEPDPKHPKPSTATSMSATKAPTTSQPTTTTSRPTTRPHALPKADAQEPGIETRTSAP